MAWTAGHTHEDTMTLAAFANAESDFTLLLTEADFAVADRGDWADAFAASPIQAECAIDSAGTSKLAIDVLAVDTVADTFVLRVGPMTTSTMADTLYWRLGSTSVSNTATAAYDASWEAYIPLQSDFADRTSNNNDFAQSGGVTAGGSTGKFGDATAFDDASSQYLSLGSGALSTPPLTVMGWFKSDDDTRDGAIAGVGDSNNDFATLEARENSGTNDIVLTLDGGPQSFGVSTTQWSANTWHHAAGTAISSGETAQAFLDGGGKGTFGSNTKTFGGWTSTAIAAQTRPGVGFDRFFSGHLQDVQFHSVERSDGWIQNEYDQAATLGQHSTSGLTAIGAAGNLAGTINAAGSAAGTLTGDGTLAGSADASATLAGDLDGTGSLAGSADAQASASGTLAGDGALSGSADAQGDAAGTLTGDGSLAGSIDAGATLDGTLAPPDGAIAGTITAGGTATGTLTGSGALAGAINAQATLAGSLADANAPGIQTESKYLALQVGPTHYLQLQVA